MKGQKILTVFLWIVIEVSCQVCRENAIRLIGGTSELEGRVEICRSGSWGTVCDDLWDQSDATVVCRQLGFSSQGSLHFLSAHFGSGTGLIALDDVQCSGNEERLADCPSTNGQYCGGHNEDAGVRCQRGITTEISFTDTSALVIWHAIPVPDKYNITVTNAVSTSAINQTYTITTEVPSSRTEIEYEDLHPGQSYRICVIGFYGVQQTDSSCVNLQTQLSPISTTAITSQPLTAPSCHSALLGGILGSIIALLVLLLMVAGVGLAYPRCIRPKVKDRKCCSNFSQFLDKNIYMTNNKAHSSAKLGARDSIRYKKDANPTSGLKARKVVDHPYEEYEVMDPPPPPIVPRRGPPSRQVTVDTEDENYEAFDPAPESQNGDYEDYEAGTNSE